MNKMNKKRSNRSNSVKTIVERAKREVPGFVEYYAKFEQHPPINGYAPSTIFNYSRAVAKISLYFGKSLLDLDADEIHPFLYHVAQQKSAGSTYFTHTVYVLRFFFRLYDPEDRVLKMPTVSSAWSKIANPLYSRPYR